MPSVSRISDKSVGVAVTQWPEQVLSLPGCAKLMPGQEFATLHAKWIAWKNIVPVELSALRTGAGAVNFAARKPASLQH